MLQESEIKLNETNTGEYRLMYFFAGWHTDTKIYAETDEEAIEDAREIWRNSLRLQKLDHEVALFKGGRKVKVFNSMLYRERIY